MIIDCRKNPAIGQFFRIVDIATGEEISRLVFYADDKKGCYRIYDVNSNGPVTHLEAGVEKVSWTECTRPIRIEPRPELNEFERGFAERMMAKMRAESEVIG